MISNTIIRKLGHKETHCKLAHEYLSATGLASFYCRIHGLLDQHKLEKALKKVVENNPTLQLTFKENDEQHFYKVTENTPLPFTIMEGKNNDAWQELYEHEHNTPIALTNDHLWRILILKNIDNNPHNHDIIAHFHHGIFDADSFFNFIEQLFQYYNCIEKREHLPSNTCSVSDAAEDAIRQRVSRCGYVYNQFGYWVKSLKIHKTKLNWEQNVKYEQRISKNIFVNIYNTPQLLSLCRHNNVTIGALLTATLLKAVNNYYCQRYNTSQTGLKMVTAIDFRCKLKKNQPIRPIGMFISTVNTNHKVNCNSDIWQLAKQYRDDLIPGIDRGIIPAHFYPKKLLKNYQKCTKKLANYFTGGIGISNSGVVDINQKHFTISDIRVTSNRKKGDFLINLNALTLNKIMRISFTYTHPLLSKESAQQIITDTLRLIDEVRTDGMT